MRTALLGRRTLLAGAGAVVAGSHTALGQGPDPALLAKVIPVTGRIRIDGLRLTLATPDKLGFLDARQTRFLFTQIYHNPESDTARVFGCILPLGVIPGSPGSFEVLIRAASGRIADTGAGSSLDPDVVKRGFIDRMEALNLQRPRGAALFRNADIVVPARYDRARHIMVVGKTFQWGNEPQPTANVDAFILTRQGAIVLTATAPLANLKLLAEAAREVAENITLDPTEAYDSGGSGPAGSVTLDQLAETLGG